MLACARRVFVVLLATFGALVVSSPATDAVPFDYSRLSPARTHLHLAPHHRTIHYNKRIRLAAELRGVVGPIARGRVSFWLRHPHGHWHKVATARTNNHGRIHLTRRLKHTTLWQARFAGDLVNRHSRSRVTRVKVLAPPPASAPFGRSVVEEAARHHGAPYQYGAAGPYRFDCSGFTMYVFGRFGISLPHNAASQYDSVRHVSRSSLRLGDLVFFDRGGGIYHVGIYAGGGRMWAATHSGDVVRLESIHAAPYVVGRAG